MLYLKECDVSSAFTDNPDKHPRVVIIARTEDHEVVSLLLRNLRTMYTGPKHVLWIDEFEGWDADRPCGGPIPPSFTAPVKDQSRPGRSHLGRGGL